MNGEIGCPTHPRRVACDLNPTCLHPAPAAAVAETAPVPAVRAYPMPGPGDNDKRFTFGLALDVAKVLVAHGFPDVVAGADFVDLQQALFQFIYRGDRA